MFDILMGVPEMKEFWDDLKARKKKNQLSGDEKELFKKFGKAIQFLAADPRHRGLQTHEIEDLTRRYGRRYSNHILGRASMRIVCSGCMGLIESK